MAAACLLAAIVATNNLAVERRTAGDGGGEDQSEAAIPAPFPSVRGAIGRSLRDGTAAAGQRTSSRESPPPAYLLRGASARRDEEDGAVGDANATATAAEVAAAAAAANDVENREADAPHELQGATTTPCYPRYDASSSPFPSYGPSSRVSAEVTVEVGGTSSTAVTYNYVCTSDDWCGNVGFAPGGVYGDLAWTMEGECTVSFAVVDNQIRATYVPSKPTMYGIILSYCYGFSQP